MAVLCLPLCDAMAAKPYKPSVTDPLSESWRWRHITPLDNPGFRCMAEGADGSMWFGVNRGVLRYDGLRWTAYAALDGLTDQAIGLIGRASDGSIYAATTDELWRFYNGGWTKLPLVMPIRCLSSSRSGILVGTNFGVLHISGEEITLYSTRSDAHVAQEMIHADFKKYIVPSDLVNAKKLAVTSVCEDHGGHLWFAVNQMQLIRFNPTAESDDRSHYQVYTHKEDLLIRWPIQIRKDAKKQIWVVSQSGVYRFAAAKRKWVRFKLSENEGSMGQDFDLSFTKTGQVRLVVLNDLYTRRNGKWSVYPIPSQEQSSPHLLETSDGCLWVAKEQGKVFRVDQTSEQWQSFEDLHFQCDDAKKRSWFITSDNRAVALSEGTWTCYSAEDGLMNTLLALYCSRDGQMWAIGSQGHTASTAYLDGGRWVRTKHESFGESFEAQVGAELKNGTMLFAARKPRNASKPGGILQVTRKQGGGYRFKSEAWPERYPGLTGIAEVAEGDVYYSKVQLYRKRGRDLKAVSFPGKSKFSHVDCMATDLQQHLWVAVRDFGLNRLCGSNWISYTAEDGLGSSRVSSLACAKDGTVWASMAHGFSRFDGKQWQPYVLDAALPGIPINSGDLKLSRHDFLWINTCAKSWYVRESLKTVPMEDSQFSFKTVRYRPLKDKPETDLIVSSQEVASEGNAYFEWSGVSRWELTPQQELTYSWRLDDGEWCSYSKRTNQLFLNLKPGEYRFEVRARDRDFNVDPSPAVCSFTVLAPVWQQGWFITMVALFVIGVIVLVYFLIRAKHETQRNQLELEQVKLRFFTSISHEFRTPLTVMLAPLNSLIDRVNDPKTKEILQMMMRNGQKLRRLVDQVLDFRKLESGHMPIEWAQGDIIEFTATIAKELILLAEQSGISIDVEAPTAAYMVWFDPDKWQKIISNLVSNAIKYTPEHGFVEVIIKVHADAGSEPQRIEVHVEDSGIGISEEEQEHIFEPYYRAKSTGEGTGIGLAFVKELLDLLDGTISVVSPVTERDGNPCGSRFCVQLPISTTPPADVKEGHLAEFTDEPEYSDSISVRPLEPTEDSKSNKPTILVVDDNEDIRTVIKLELVELYSVLTAENGEVGLSIAKERLPALVLSDVMMPIMDGNELCKELKTSEITRHIPVIMLTARISQQHELEGLEHGADDYIKKPFSIPVLQARIANVLEARRVMRERYNREIQVGTLDVEVESADQKFMERAISAIEEHMSDWDFGVDQLAQVMNLTVRSLRYKLKAVADQTPSALIRTVRLSHAKRLLEDLGNTLSVSEVASSLGFTDMSNFSRAFKKQFGQPPSTVASKKQS